MEDVRRSLLFLAAATELSSSTATGPDKVAFPTLNHFRRSGMDFLLHIFNLSWSLHSFYYIWITLIPIYKIGKPLEFPVFFWLISLNSCVSKLCECIISSRLVFFLNSNSIFSPRQAGFRPSLLSIKFCFFLSPLRMGSTKPGQALAQFSLLSTSPKLSTLSDTPPFSTNVFRLEFLFAIFVGLNLSFLIGVLAWIFKITEVASFKSVEMFRKYPLSALYVLLFINYFPSAAFFTLIIWVSDPPSNRFLLHRRPHKELWYDWNAGLSTGIFPLNRSKYEVLLFSADPHQANFQSHLFLFNPLLCI